MGEDKTLMPFAPYPTFTHFLFERMSEIFTDVKVSAKSQKFTPPLPLLADDFEDFCPFFVLSNLDKYYKEPVFIIPADSPFIKFETIKRLWEALLAPNLVNSVRAAGQSREARGFGALSPERKDGLGSSAQSNLKYHQISLPRAGERAHNLCGFFAPSVAKVARELIKNGERRAGALVNACDSVITEFADAAQFLNLNTPQDIAKIDEKALF